MAEMVKHRDKEKDSLTFLYDPSWIRRMAEMVKHRDKKENNLRNEQEVHFASNKIAGRK